MAFFCSRGKINNVEMKRFSVTAIIPIFNEEKNIESILNNAKNQTLPFNKIIIINDGSTDKSLKKILKFKNLKKLQIINNISNQGINKSLNNALKFVKSKFFFVMSAGDTYNLNINKWCEEIFKSKENIGMICGNIKINYPSNNKIISRNLPFEKNILLNKTHLINMAKKRNVTFFGGGVMMNTNYVINLGGYSEELEWIADWYLYLVLGMKYKFICLNKVFATLKVREGDYSKSLFNWKKNKIVLRNFLSIINSDKTEKILLLKFFKKHSIIPIYDFRMLSLLFYDKNFRNFCSLLLFWRIISYKLGKYLSYLVPCKYHNVVRTIFRI